MNKKQEWVFNLVWKREEITIERIQLMGNKNLGQI